MPDDLGDRLKELEAAEAQRRLMPLLPVIARIDGRCFSNFTQGLDRPYDVRMCQAMVETTKFLVSETNARVGYTQSDELTLVWYEDNYKSQIFFDRRIQKMCSQLAALASVFFYEYVRSNFPPEYAKKLPTFDARIWNVPILEEAANAVLWRSQDALKNSINSATRCYYSAKEMHKKSCKQMQEMLWKKGINWNDYPAFFKRGTYVLRREVKRKFDPILDADLPEKHNARKNPDFEFSRSVIQAVEMPILSTITNRIEVLFFGAEPVIKQRTHDLKGATK